MMLPYTPRARSDFAKIYDYITQENNSAARHVILLIRKVTESLLENPQIGRPGRVEGTQVDYTSFSFPGCLSN